MEEYSETSAHRIQTSGNHPNERVQHSTFLFFVKKVRKGKFSKSATMNAEVLTTRNVFVPFNFNFHGKGLLGI